MILESCQKYVPLVQGLDEVLQNTSHNAYHVTCNDKFTPRTVIASSSDRSIARRHAPPNVSKRLRMHLMGLQFYFALLMHLM
jgi:hypothetical protein